MVIVKQLKPINFTMANNELRLDSNRLIRFTAPPCVDMVDSNEDQYAIRKRSGSNQFNNVINDNWDGVKEFCQALDDVIVIEKDIELFLGKSVLEIGFTTGIPSMLALDSGANEITLHSWDQQSMSTYVKGTVSRNLIPKSLVKFTTGELETCLTSLKGKKFDIILCPELLNTNEENFPVIHQILNSALAEHGLILLSGRSFYDNVSGSIPAFLDYIKANNTFDAFVRWSSSKNEANPRKLLQITRL